MINVKGIILIFLIILAASEGAGSDKITIALRNDIPPLSFVNMDGQPVGMYVDIWKLWAEKTGQRIEFRLEILKDTLESLKNGKADIHGALNYSEERSQWMAFSQPFYENSQCVFFLKNQKKISNIKDLEGYKAGVIRSPHEKALRKDYPGIEFITFDVLEEMIQAAREGKIRAFIGTPQFVSMTSYRLGLTGEFESTDEELFAAKVHAGILKENTELLALIDKGFDAISDKELAEIEARWIPDSEKRYYASPSKTIRLTLQEQAWIKSHKTIRVGIGKTFPPFQFVENNEPIGIVPDYLNLIGERTGIRFELIPIEWNNVDAIAKNRDIDIHLSNDISLRKEWMNFTIPFFNIDFVIVSRNDMPFVSHLVSLKGKKVAILKGLLIYEKIKKDYPEIEIYPVNDAAEAIQSVASGNSDVYIGSLIGAAYQIHKHRFSNLKIAGLTGFSHQPMMFAVRNDWNEMVDIINKAIISISRQEHEAIYQKWLPIRFEHTADWSLIIRWVSVIGSFFIIILGITFFWNRRLAKEIHDRRRAEQRIQEQNEEIQVQNEELQSQSEELQAMNEELIQNSEMLKISEAQFRSMFENHHAVMLLLDPENGKIIRANQAAREYYGYTAEEFETLTIYQINQLSKEEVDSELADANIEKCNCFHFPHKLASGEVRDVEVHSSPIPFKGKSILFSIIHDITERKQIENRNQLLTSIIERSQDFIGIATPDQHAFYVNHAGQKMLGLDNDEMVRKTKIEEYFLPEDIPFIHNTIVPQLMSEGRWAGEFRFKHFKTGEPIDVYYDFFLTEDPATKEIYNFATISRNITLQKKTERELIQAKEKAEKSEERFNLAMKASNDGIFDWNLETNEIYYSPGWKKMLGYEEHELPNDFSVWEKTTDPEDVKKSWELQKKLIAKQTDRFVSEFKMKHKAGHWVDILARAEAIFNESGKAVRIVGTHTDITERKRAEEALLKSNMLLEAVIKQAPFAIHVLDGDLDHIHVVIENEESKRIMGESIEGRTDIDANLPERLVSRFFTADGTREIPLLNMPSPRAFRGEFVKNEEFLFRHPDGTEIFVDASASPVYDHANQIVAVVVTFHDITERKQLEANRLELERQILNMKKIESLIRTSAGISHSFNNILFAVTGNIEMAMADIPPGSSIRRTLEEAFKAATRASDLTRKILAYSGSGFFALKEVNINSVIEKNMRALRAAIPETISFGLSLTEDIPLISADSEQIHRLIMNILVNASEAIGENVGQVILSTGVSNSYDDSLKNGLKRVDNPDETPESGRFVYMEISDTGCGMDEESLKLLFDPFFTTKFMGRGLGMSEVQGIVRTHKGEILVKSETGRGTTIRVLFPVADSAPKITERKPVHREISQADTLPKTILVADDEEPVRRVCDMMLNRLGYRTMMAADGDEAIDIFKESADHILCVLLDLTMPKKDGIAALKEMRRIREDVRVIISSGHSREEISRRFKDHGLSGILQKPFCLNDLRHELGSIGIKKRV